MQHWLSTMLMDLRKKNPAYQGDITMKRKHLQWALENAGNFYINFI